MSFYLRFAPPVVVNDDSLLDGSREVRAAGGAPHVWFHSSSFGSIRSASELCGVRAFISVALSGIVGNRSTLYPAVVSISSRSLSFASFPWWLLSSSSITARTLNPLSVSTKSARFWEKLSRLAPCFAVSNAPKLTCMNTMCSGIGKASTNRQNIFCSWGVAILRDANVPFLAERFGESLATIAAIAIKTSNKYINFTISPFLACFCMRIVAQVAS